MIQSLHLKNFKCFQDQCFQLGNLTLLTGLNGTGKSSVIQSLLLLRQSYQHLFLEKGKLFLNGELVQLGTARDVLYNDAVKDEFGFDLDFNTLKGQWHFEYDATTQGVGKQISVTDSFDYNTNLFDDNFHYLPAERIGPQPVFETSEYFVSERQQLGAKGEYAPHFLQTFYTKHLTHNRLAHPNISSSTQLHLHVDAWMGEISPGIHIPSPELYQNIGRIDLRYEFDVMGRGRNLYRSTNVGFGITYTLPILLALLASEPDTLVLLENPEAHLHPQGQFKLGELMARAASCGIQVIVETHSEHIINAIHQATSNQGSQIIDREKVFYYELSRQAGQINTKVESPQVINLVSSDLRLIQH